MPPKQDSERHHISLDDLLVRTVAALDIWSERLPQIEQKIQELTLGFGKHEATQAEVLRQLQEHIVALKKAQETIVKTMGQHDIDIQTCKADRAQIKSTLMEIGVDQEEADTILNDLNVDLQNRQIKFKHIQGYLHIFWETLVRHITLPLLLFILVVLGIDSRYNPWAKPSSTPPPSSPTVASQARIDFYQMVDDKHAITESNMKRLESKYPKEIFIVNSIFEARGILHAAKNIVIVAVIPVDLTQTAYAQIYDADGACLGSAIAVLRGQ
jgi:hypothetical protein